MKNIVISFVLIIITSCTNIDNNISNQDAANVDANAYMGSMTLTPSYVNQYLYTMPPKLPDMGPTLDYFQTKTQETINTETYNICGNNAMKYFSKSPSNKWASAECIDVQAKKAYTTIIEINGNKTWMIDDTEFSHHPYKWTKDENYLFFSENACPGGAVCDGIRMWPFNGIDGLYRINLQDGNIINVFPHSKTTQYSISFSPDEKQIAFTDLLQKPPRIGVRNIENWSDDWIDIDNKYYEIGFLLWSSDGNKIVFTAIYKNEVTMDYELPRNCTMLYVNVNKLEIKVTGYYENKFLKAVEWIGPNNVVMDSYQGYWIVNVEYGSIQPTDYHK
jgi:hypothetical protein